MRVLQCVGGGHGDVLHGEHAGGGHGELGVGEGDKLVTTVLITGLGTETQSWSRGGVFVDRNDEIMPSSTGCRD